MKTLTFNETSEISGGEITLSIAAGIVGFSIGLNIGLNIGFALGNLVTSLENLEKAMIDFESSIRMENMGNPSLNKDSTREFII